MRTKKEISKTRIATSKTKFQLPVFQQYPAQDHILGRDIVESTTDPDNISTSKYSNQILDRGNKRDFSGVAMGSDLDVPGSELDVEYDIAGNDDEENSYYSLGGDNHQD